MPNSHRNSAWLIYLFIVGVYLVLAIYNPVAYVWLTYEDLYGEWLQTWLFVAIFVLAAAVARKPGPYRWFFVFLSVAGFYTFMEEISWGQRLFGVESPDFFDEYNIQSETNLHNFLTGPESTILKDVVEYTLAAALLTYGLIYPLLLRMRSAPAVFLNNLGVVPPPLYLAVFFVTAAPLEIGVLDFNEAEVAEILVGTSISIMLLHYLLVGFRDSVNGLPGIPDVPTARLLSVMYAAGFLGLVTLAYGTTAIVNTAEEIRYRTDGRIINGYKKYARRFEDRQRWSGAAEFYRRVYVAIPEDVEMLRHAINNYKAAGDMDNYRKYYRQLLELTATPEAVAATGVDTQLSFARSYAEIGESAAVQQFLDRALFFATERVKRFPENPENHYWLGRARQQRGEYAEALAAYEAAVTLGPENKRYRSVLKILKRRVGELAGDKPAD